MEKPPNGYEIYESGGDVSGDGLLDLNGKHLDVDIERCADICDNNKQCKAIIYSKRWGQCKLSVYEAPECDQYRDWIFYQRMSKFRVTQSLLPCLVFGNAIGMLVYSETLISKNHDSRLQLLNWIHEESWTFRRW